MGNKFVVPPSGGLSRLINHLYNFSRSGRSAKIKRNVFLHLAEIPEYMQKTAALYFCTPDL